MKHNILNRAHIRIIQLTAHSILLLLLSLAIFACSRISNENYRKIEMGMEFSQVTQILGEPEQCDAVLNAKTCTWGNRNKSIDIQFVEEKVVFFSSKGL